MNTSHRINHLSFGQKVHTIENQLDGVWFVSEQGNRLELTANSCSYSHECTECATTLYHNFTQ